MGVFAGAGCDDVCPDNTDREPLAVVRRTATTESVIEVTMKITADQVVALVSAVAAPRGPNAV